MSKVKNRKDANGHVLRKGESLRTDGRYIFQYLDTMGKKRIVYAQTLPALREKEDKLQKDRLDGIRMYSCGKANLNYVYDRYISTKQHLKKNTLTNYDYMYDRFIRSGFGKKDITEIIYSDVLHFYLYLMNEKGLKINTLESIQTLLHPVFQMAVRDNVIRVNPTEGAYAEIKKRFGDNSDKRHPLTIEQQKAFLDFTKESPIYHHWYPLMVFLFGTGCRIGEALGLCWQDVDFESREISINHSLIYLCRHGEKAYYYISTPKTAAGYRTIPMLESVKLALEEEHQRCEVTGFTEDVIDGMSGFIFSGRDGHVINPMLVNRAIKRIYMAYNEMETQKAEQEKRDPVLIPHFSAHHIRHTFCTRFCEVETNIKAIQRIMGHSCFETTMDIYADATEDAKKKAMSSLENSNLFVT